MLKNNTRIVSWGGIILALAGVVIALPLLTKTSAPQAGPAGPPGPPQVGVISLKQQDVLRATELPGRTAAVMTSEVRPQVNGVILKRLFTEGSDVKEGQQLYQIDPATYKAAYDNAVAALDKAKAALATAQAKAVRYKKLIDAEMISRQDYDDVVATARQDQADIASAEASVEQTRINLGYTKVFPPSRDASATPP